MSTHSGIVLVDGWYHSRIKTHISPIETFTSSGSSAYRAEKKQSNHRGEQKRKKKIWFLSHRHRRRLIPIARNCTSTLCYGDITVRQLQIQATLIGITEQADGRAGNRPQLSARLCAQKFLRLCSDIRDSRKMTTSLQNLAIISAISAHNALKNRTVHYRPTNYTSYETTDPPQNINVFIGGWVSLPCKMYLIIEWLSHWQLENGQNNPANFIV